METKVIVITGVSGTGKSAVLRKLQELEYAVIGIDEEPGLTSWIHKETGEIAPRGSELTESFLRTYDWGCDTNKLADLIEKAPKPVFICGSADNIIEIIALADLTLLLVCSPEIFIGRINNRTEHDYGKDEESRKALLGYYEEYNQICLDAGVVEVDAGRPLDEVVETILSQI